MIFLTVALSLATPQQSLARFDAAIPIVDHLHRLEFLTDFNVDGELDAVSLYRASSSGPQYNLKGLAGAADGSFSPAWGLSVERLGTFYGDTLAVGNLDGDQRADYVGSLGAHFFACRYTTSASVPSVTQSEVAAYHVRELELVDVTGDGLDDAVMLTSLGELKVYVNQGAAGAYRLEFRSRVPMPGLGAKLVVGELTGDGTPDAVVTTADATYLWPIAPGGQLLAATVYPAANVTQTVVGASIGDIDGDQDQDLVLFEYDPWTGEPAHYTVLRRTGPSTLERELPVLGGPATDFADVDGDGDLDGVCCGGSGTPSSTWTNARPAKFEISINDGAGVFAPAFQIQGLGAQHITGVADLDHDGDQDLVGGRVVYYARGPLTEAPYGNSERLSAHPSSIVDYDCDGDLDFDVGMSGLMRSSGDGEVEYAALDGPAAPAGTAFRGPGYAGDWNGDGTIDLIVAHEAAGSLLSMRLLSNAGGGHFEDAGAASAPGVDLSLGESLDASHYMCADADGDGDNDLIVHIDTPGVPASSRIWWNDGIGSFSAFDDHFRIMAVAHLNGDGWPDLVAARKHHSSQWNDPFELGRQRATGPGTFDWFRAFPYPEVEPTMDRVAAADVDNDGDIDILSANHDRGFGGDLELWRNQTTGSTLFFEYDDFEPGLTPWTDSIQVFVTDVNGDGWTDIVGGPAVFAWGASVVLLRDPSGIGYLPHELHCILPRHMADIDGDGDADVIADDLVENFTIDGPAAGARRQYGAGIPGTGGAVPQIGASGPFRVGETSTLHVRGGLGGAFCFVTIGFSESLSVNTPFAGLTAYNDPWFRRLPTVLNGIPGTAGSGGWDIDFVVNPVFSGLNLYYEAWVVDSAGPGGLVHSGGLELQFR